MATEEFKGFANAPVDEKTGERLDFRDVDPFVDESDEGKALAARQSTPSSIAQFKTDDQSTEGSPMAKVPDPRQGEDPDAAGDASTADVPDDVKEAADKAEADAKSKSAGGEEVKGS